MHGMRYQHRQGCPSVKGVGIIIAQLQLTLISYKLHLYGVDHFSVGLYFKSYRNTLLAYDYKVSVALLPGRYSYSTDLHFLSFRDQLHSETFKRHLLRAPYHHVDRI